jgi:molybdopterin/thiamine biosynthesis adenylyltransferase
MNDEQLLRYSRQILLGQVGYEGQEKLLASRVLLVGVGGLGSPVAMYLATAGVGELVLSDPDQVGPENLQRQIAFRRADIGRDKVEAARQSLAGLNPDVRCTVYNKCLDPAELEAEVGRADVVVDASDNFATRFALNRVCREQRTPLVSGAVIRLEGQVAVFRLDRPDSPCYRCLYQDMEEVAETCAETGVLGPVAGIIGSVQATETLKLLLGIGRSLDGRLLVLDALTMSWRTLALRKDPECPVCGG